MDDEKDNIVDRLQQALQEKEAMKRNAYFYELQLKAAEDHYKEAVENGEKWFNNFILVTGICTLLFVLLIISIVVRYV